jgi:iron complex outermembrane recepter protein
VPQAGNVPVRIQLAADVTTNPANNQPICRSTLTNPNNGCVPVNLFGVNNFSQAARDYLYGTSVLGMDLKQHLAALNFQGDLFDTWAGAVPLAMGVEYRTNKVDTSADPISRSSGFYVFNATEVEGEIKVKEAFLETVVPLARDLPGARLLELNGAARSTDYDITGRVTTWKYGAVYEPIEGVRLRATKSRDIRAPNLDELYRPRTTALTAVNTVLTPIVSGGSTDLVPEEADTFTVGATFTGWGPLEGFRASVDYYDIEIDDVISTLTAQTLLTRCRTSATYCDQITFTNPADVQSAPTEIRTVFQNLNQLEVSGFDFEFGYNLPLGEGSLDLSLLATRTVHLKTTDISGLSIDRAGVTGNNASGGGAGMPEWQANSLITYANGPASVTLETRYIDSGIFDVTLIGPDNPGYAAALAANNAFTINRNEVASAIYFNLGGTFKFEGFKGSEMELFAGVQNLLDRDPPVAPSNQGSSNLILFDPLGRAYRLGVRANF